MSRVTRRVFCVLAVGLLASSACLSPTLPLPPPHAPEVSSAGQGLVTLSGDVPEPGVPVFAANDTLGIYAGRDADAAGHYEFSIAAESGHEMRVWYVVGNHESHKRDFRIPEFDLESLPTPEVSPPNGDGFVSVSGTVPKPLAQVFVHNLVSEETFSTESDTEGEFSIEVPAVAGDQLELWYKFGQDFSPVITVDVSEE